MKQAKVKRNIFKIFVVLICASLFLSISNHFYQTQVLAQDLVYNYSFDDKDKFVQEINACPENFENCQFVGSVDNGSLYFGNKETKNYNFENKRVYGVFEIKGANAISIPESDELVLKINQKLVVEKGLDWDNAIIELSSQGGEGKVTYDLKSENPDGLGENEFSLDGPLEIDITEFSGEKLEIKFIFDTISEENNNFFGWEIFDFEILKTSPEQSSPGPLEDADQEIGIAEVKDENTRLIWDFEGGEKMRKVDNAEDKPNLWKTIECPQENIPNCKEEKNFLYHGNFNGKEYDYAVGLEFYEGSGGKIRSENIQIPNEGEIVLTYNYAIEVEKLKIYDLAELRILEGQNIKNIWQKNEQTEMKKEPQTATINLNEYKGKTIQLEAFFDTVDNLNNSSLGWQILDLKIENTLVPVSTPTPVENPQPEEEIVDEAPENEEPIEEDIETPQPTPTSPTFAPWKLSATNLSAWQKQNHPNLPFLQNLWSVQNSGSGLLNYGIGAKYDNGQRNAGSMVSPNIQLPANTSLELSIDHQISVENSPNWDRASVFVRPAGSNSGTKVWSGNNTNRTITKIDLTSFAGQNIQLEFRFDTIDKFFNATSGWQIFEAGIN